MFDEPGARLREELQDLAEQLEGGDSLIDRLQAVTGISIKQWIDEASVLLGGTSAFLTWMNVWARERFFYHTYNEERRYYEFRVGDPLKDGTPEELERWFHKISGFVMLQIANGVTPAEAIEKSTGGADK